MKPRRTPSAEEVAFADNYRELHKRHGLSWAINLAGAALGVAVGADTVYVDDEKGSAVAKEVEQATT